MLRLAIPALAMLGCAAAWGQDALPGPAEAPPEGHGTDAFVDSAGCGFLRIVVGGETVWAPRFRDDGSQMCGLSPSLAAEAPLFGTDTDRTTGGPTSGADTGAARAPGIYVQAGAFGLAENAQRVRDGFIARGWGGATTPAGRLTAVYAGPFLDVAAAETALRDIRREGMPDAFIVTLD